MPEPPSHTGCQTGRRGNRRILRGGNERARAPRQPASGHCARCAGTARSTPLPTRPLGAIVSGHMITRRGFLGGSVVLLAAPRAAEAQQAGKIYRLGLLSLTPTPNLMEAWRQGLRELGWIEGQN